jgi:hypothetical protein
MSFEDVERFAESAKGVVTDAADKLKELRLQVHADAQEVKQAAGDALQIHSMEKEIRQSRRQAEAEHQDAVRQLKTDVEAEAKELKQLMKED